MRESEGNSGGGRSVTHVSSKRKGEGSEERRRGRVSGESRKQGRSQSVSCMIVSPDQTKKVFQPFE